MSKFALEAYATALRQELSVLPAPPYVVVVRPGPVNTPLSTEHTARCAYEHAQATGVVTSSVASDRLDEASLRSWAAALYLMEGGEETPPRAERQGRARSPRFAARRRCLLTPPLPSVA